MPLPPESRPPQSRSWTKRAKTAVVSWLLLMIVRALALTYRFRFEHRDATDRARALHERGSYCLALWHEHLFACIIAHKGGPFAPLASLSSDGDIVTFVMNRLGFKTVRGSSSRGGPEARDDLVEITNQGWFTALTVDGPRGPRRRVKGGVVDVARRSGVAIVPLVAVADRIWVLHKSWDQFKIPKPFAKIVIAYGDPIVVSADTQGLLFGEAKQKVRAGLDKAEVDATQALTHWSAP